ncbi:hypothetical protein [Amycolatopsis sp. NBC_01480]|uniref:hypothetical protein n=1 Tax=Amycolatopsis sp. NBC_01480 TaxID=2903562 RepID=UPI002E2D83D1|nr:hypothetical protein [Amycolatopsis sp. NBC_01480]
MARKPADHPASTNTPTRRHRKRGSDDDSHIDQDNAHTTTRVEATPETIDSGSATRETYAQQQARLDAEAVDRWAVIVVDWPPMTEEQIRALAVILNRIDARQAQQRPGGKRNG